MPIELKLTCLLLVWYTNYSGVCIFHFNTPALKLDFLIKKIFQVLFPEFDDIFDVTFLYTLNSRKHFDQIYKRYLTVT